MKQKQQGDLILKRIEALPEGERVELKPAQHGHVLAEGEATGHAHTVPAGHGTMTRIGAKLFLTVHVSTEVTHEEHGPVTLEPGIWEIGRVREWDYLSKMERTVAD